ncbi:MAG TPA: hypothetical protein VG965_02330 [Patescibacteria group bacterium]|nr:hypothetical protein [Patescibacteria group bacterium]
MLETSSNSNESFAVERLSDEQMGNLLAAVGNHEAKAITLGIMEPGRVYRQKGLRNAVLRAQGKNPGWRINIQGPIQYCFNSFEPIGLVAKEALRADFSTDGYFKTPKGEAQGEALAGLVLDFSLRYPNFSLQDFFSVPSSSSAGEKIGEGEEYKERAPLVRLKILQRLLSMDKPIRISDVVNNLGEDYERIRVHLESMRDWKIIDYDSISYGKNFSFYKLSDEAPQEDPDLIYNTERIYPQFVYRLLKDHPNRVWTREEIGEEYIKSGISKKSLKNATMIAAGILNLLKERGYAERSKFGSGLQSEISLQDDQRIMIRDLVTTLSRFQNQNVGALEFGRRRLRDILVDGPAVSRLIAKAKEHSIYANRQSKADTADVIYAIVLDNSGCAIRDIQKKLKDAGKKLQVPSIRTIMQLLVADGRVGFKVEKGIHYYHPQ